MSLGDLCSYYCTRRRMQSSHCQRPIAALLTEEAEVFKVQRPLWALRRVAFSDSWGGLQAQLLLESAGAMKSKTAKDGAFAVLSTCALKYGHLEAVAGAAVAALARNEHMAVALAELAEYSQAKYDDARLVSWRCRLATVADFTATEAFIKPRHPILCMVITHVQLLVVEVGNTVSYIPSLSCLCGRWVSSQHSKSD